MTDEAMTILANYFIDHEIQASEGLPDSFKEVAIDGMKEYWRHNPETFARQWGEFLEMNTPKTKIFG